MKKVLAFFAVMAAVSFSSCGNKSAEATTEPVAETEEVVVVEEVAPVADEAEAVEDSTATPVEAAPAE